MNEKILTISIAAYNAENYLAKCIDSLVNTSVLDELEIIVVNDGSTDRTKTIARNYEIQYPSIVKVINKVNGGHGSTVNTSIENATGKYYKIVDADDWVEKDGIEKLVTYLKKSDCDLILNPYWEIDALSGKKNQMIKPCNDSVPNEKEFNLKNGYQIMPYMHSLTFRTEIVKKMGAVIDENCFFVDMEYALFPLEYVENVIVLGFPVYDYLLGNSTQSMAMDNMVKRRDQHLKVTKRLLEYYINNLNRLEGNKKNIFMERLKYAAYNQYKIYYYMASSEGKKELMDFDKWLRLQSIEIYTGPVGRFMKVVKFDRSTKWLFWQCNIWLMKKIGLKIQA